MSRAQQKSLGKTGPFAGLSGNFNAAPISEDTIAALTLNAQSAPKAAQGSSMPKDHGYTKAELALQMHDQLVIENHRLAHANIALTELLDHARAWAELLAQEIDLLDFVGDNCYELPGLPAEDGWDLDLEPEFLARFAESWSDYVD